MLDRRRLTRGRARSGGVNAVATQIKRKIFGIPAIGTATSIHASVTDDGTEQTISTGFTQPDIPRTVSAYVTDNAGDDNNIGAISVTIHGTNASDGVISEVLPPFDPLAGAGDSSEVVGTKAFKTVTSVVLPAHDALGVKTSIGLPFDGGSTQLGLGRILTRNTYLRVFIGGIAQASAPTKLVIGPNMEDNTLSVDPDGLLAEFDYYTI